jgi:hypothetical protein
MPSEVAVRILGAAVPVRTLAGPAIAAGPGGTFGPGSGPTRPWQRAVAMADA